jgi:hypothetical protein
MGAIVARKHPRDMGPREVEAFLTMLATERKVFASTHNQALSAILFLYREVLAIKLPWLDDFGRPSQKRRIPSVMTHNEVAGLLAQMKGETALLARLLYGTGMRLMEGITMIYTHVLVVAAGGTASPLDALGRQVMNVGCRCIPITADTQAFAAQLRLGIKPAYQRAPDDSKLAARSLFAVS